MDEMRRIIKDDVMRFLSQMTEGLMKCQKVDHTTRLLEVISKMTNGYVKYFEQPKLIHLLHKHGWAISDHFSSKASMREVDKFLRNWCKKRNANDPNYKGDSNAMSMVGYQLMWRYKGLEFEEGFPQAPRLCGIEIRPDKITFYSSSKGGKVERVI